MLRLSNIALFTSAACALALTVGAPASAETAPTAFTIITPGDGAHAQTMSARVFYGDLDLTTGAGQKMLRQRVRKAAVAVCGQLDEGPGPTGFAFSCEDMAVDVAARGERAAIARAKTDQIYAAAAPVRSVSGK